MQKLADMNKITVKKDKLVKTLRFNRKKHQEDFNKALDGYRETLVEYLENQLGKAMNKEDVDFHSDYPIKPSSYVEQYDEVILMLEYGEDTEMALESHDFKRYVLDKWDWKRNFEVSNAGYLNKRK